MGYSEENSFKLWEDYWENVIRISKEVTENINKYYNKKCYWCGGDVVMDKIRKEFHCCQGCGAIYELVQDGFVRLSVSGDSIIYYVPKGFVELFLVYSDAIKQAAFGKGNERHGDGKPFSEQDICREARTDVGLGFNLGQARKKIKESIRLAPDDAINELLGAMNYLAGAIIVLQERLSSERLNLDG